MLVIGKKRPQPRDRPGRGPFVCRKHIRGKADSCDQGGQLHRSHAQREGITACAVKLHAITIFLIIDRS